MVIKGERESGKIDLLYLLNFQGFPSCNPGVIRRCAAQPTAQTGMAKLDFSSCICRNPELKAQTSKAELQNTKLSFPNSVEVFTYETAGFLNVFFSLRA